MRRNQKLERIRKPRIFNVELTRIPDRNGNIDSASDVDTNVPWSVIDHSPDGFNWGYGGSGPADLALNILNAFVPPGTDGHEEVNCYRNTCSRTAWDLHQAFKNEFLVGMSMEGGPIEADTITEWLEAHTDERT